MIGRLFTGFLGIVVAALMLHIVFSGWFPRVIERHYPASIARIYSNKPGIGKRGETVKLEPVEGRPGISNVILTESAVDRLGIETTTIEARPVERSRRIAGFVVAGTRLPPEVPAAARTDRLVVLVPLSGRTDRPAKGEPASVLPLDATRPGQAAATTDGFKAEPLAMVAGDLRSRMIASATPTAAPSVAPNPAAAAPDAAAKPAAAAPPAPSNKPAEPANSQGHGSTMIYGLGGSQHAFEPGDLVLVKVPLMRNGATASVLPATAVLYEPNGTAWVYENSKPQTFVRRQVRVEFTDRGTSVLSRGPSPGTKVVTIGAFELYGAESAIGIEKVGH